MNIALVILHCDPARGGAERYTVDLAHALADRGNDVAVLASSFSEVREPVRKILLDSRGPTRLRRYLRFLNSMDAHLDQTQYDIVHAMLPVRQCDVYHPHAGIAAEATANRVAQRSNRLLKNLVKWSRSLNRRRQAFAEVERALLEGSQPPTVLCLSEYVKQTARQYYRLNDSKLATLFNAVDTRKFDPAARPEAGRVVRERLGIPPGDTVALMIAQDYQRKGLAEAALATESLAQASGLRLVVVGKQDASPYLKSLNSNGRAGEGIYAGSTDDPYAYYRAADFFVLPTRHDPCSLVVLEALAMGLPVISTAFNGACEIMTDGTHGFVLPDPADVPALAEAMRKMLDPQRRQQMSEACLALRPRLAYEQHLKELLKIYGCR